MTHHDHCTNNGSRPILFSLNLFRSLVYVINVPIRAMSGTWKSPPWGVWDGRIRVIDGSNLYSTKSTLSLCTHYVLTMYSTKSTLSQYASKCEISSAFSSAFCSTGKIYYILRSIHSFCRYCCLFIHLSTLSLQTWSHKTGPDVRPTICSHFSYKKRVLEITVSPASGYHSEWMYKMIVGVLSL